MNLMIRKPEVLPIISQKSQTKSVSGVATVGSKLFVVHYKSSFIIAYSTSDFAELPQIEVADMKDPSSLTACQYHNCLYISDYGLTHIHRVDLSNFSVTKWLMDVGPRGLSVTRNHHLLVTLSNSNRIREYTTYGSFLREIILDVSIGWPQHSIELSSGHFVVCSYLQRNRSDKRHIVCMVDTSGRIIQSYGGHKGSSAGQVNRPVCLAVDKHGCVFVADSNNNKVQKLSPTLTHLSDKTRHEMDRPNCLYLDELNGRLYVGEQSGRVLVLDELD
jgi:hypothetical protein